MRSNIFALALCAGLAVSGAQLAAKEISVKLDDNGQNAVASLPSVLDQCVAGMTLRSDAASCRLLASFLAALSNDAKAAAAREAATPPAPAAAPAAPTAPAAE